MGPIRSILIVGCGYVGESAGKLFKTKGYEVWGTTRNLERAQILKKNGIHPIEFDLNKPEHYQRLPSFQYLLLSPAPTGSTLEEYKNVYQDGISHFLSHLKKNSSFKRGIYTSSTGVFAQNQGEWVQEGSPIIPSHPKKSVLYSAEKNVLENRKFIILRLGGIYGPGRNRIGQIKNQDLKWAKENKYVNLIHIEDVSRAIVHLMEKGKTNQVYLGVDRRPVPRSVMAAEIAALMKISPFGVLGEKNPLGGKRCSNQKLIDSGYQFRYPDFISGYRQLIQGDQVNLKLSGGS